MINTLKEELLELIAHKLHFLENPVQFVGINNLKPLSYMSQDYAKDLKAVDLGATQPDTLPKEAGLVFIQLGNQSLAEVLASLPQVMGLPGLLETLANTQERIVLVDDVVFKNSSDMEQLEIMAEVFYPKFFSIGHEGKAWVKLSL